MGEAAVIWGRLTEAFWLNCQLFGLTLLFALPLGLVVSFGSMSRLAPLRGVVKTFVWVIRGTPLMLQILVIYFRPRRCWASPAHGRPAAAGVWSPPSWRSPSTTPAISRKFTAAASRLCPGASTEAGQVLGMTKTQIFFRVTLLQVVKRILPPMGNEIITLVKDTSLARVIAIQGHHHDARKSHSAKGLIWPLFSTAVFFLVFVGALTLLFGWLEKRLDYFRVRGRGYGIVGSKRHRQELWCHRGAARHLVSIWPKGEALAIIGSSGSGKTTLLRCLNFLETADTGSITVAGETLLERRRHQNAERRSHPQKAAALRPCVPELQPVSPVHGAAERHAGGPAPGEGAPRLQAEPAADSGRH